MKYVSLCLLFLTGAECRGDTKDSQATVYIDKEAQILSTDDGTLLGSSLGLTEVTAATSKEKFITPALIAQDTSEGGGYTTFATGFSLRMSSCEVTNLAGADHSTWHTVTTNDIEGVEKDKYEFTFAMKNGIGYMAYRKNKKFWQKTKDITKAFKAHTLKIKDITKAFKVVKAHDGDNLGQADRLVKFKDPKWFDRYQSHAFILGERKLDIQWYSCNEHVVDSLCSISAIFSRPGLDGSISYKFPQFAAERLKDILPPRAVAWLAPNQLGAGKAGAFIYRNHDIVQFDLE